MQHPFHWRCELRKQVRPQQRVICIRTHLAHTNLVDNMPCTHPAQYLKFTRMHQFTPFCEVKCMSRLRYNSKITVLANLRRLQHTLKIDFWCSREQHPDSWHRTFGARSRHPMRTSSNCQPRISACHPHPRWPNYEVSNLFEWY